MGEDYDDSGNENKSSFNEALFKMQRFHKAQTIASTARFNPLIFNQDYQSYNYQLTMDSNNNLLLEVWGKLTDKEREDVVKMKEAIELMTEQYPIFTHPRDSSGKTKDIFHKKNWVVLKKWIFNYETKMKELMARTKYDSPSEDESGLFD